MGVFDRKSSIIGAALGAAIHTLDSMKEDTSAGYMGSSSNADNKYDDLFLTMDQEEQLEAGIGSV